MKNIQNCLKILYSLSVISNMYVNSSFAASSTTSRPSSGGGGFSSSRPSSGSSSGGYTSKPSTPPPSYSSPSSRPSPSSIPVSKPPSSTSYSPSPTNNNPWKYVPPTNSQPTAPLKNNIPTTPKIVYGGFKQVPTPPPPSKPFVAPSNTSVGTSNSTPIAPKYVSKFTGKTYNSAEERRTANQDYLSGLRKGRDLERRKITTYGQTIDTVPVRRVTINNYKQYGYSYPPSSFDQQWGYSPTHGYYNPSWGYVALGVGMNPELALATGMVDLNTYFIYKLLYQQKEKTHESQDYEQSQAYREYNQHFKITPLQDLDNGYEIGDFFKAIDNQSLSLASGGSCISMFDATLKIINFSKLGNDKAAELEYFPSVEENLIPASNCKHSKVIVLLKVLSSWNERYIDQAQTRIHQENIKVQAELGNEYQVQKEEIVPSTTASNLETNLTNAIIQNSTTNESVTIPSPELKLCGGPTGGNYVRTMKSILRTMEDNSPESDINGEVVATSGSGDIFEKVSTGECQIGIVQSDVLFHKNKSLKNLHLEPSASIVTFYDNNNSSENVYEEMAHLLCNKSMNVSNVSDLNASKGHKILIPGGANSGSAITWKTLVELDKASWTKDNYDLIPVSYVNNSNNKTPFENALQLAANTPGNCIFFVSSPNSSLIKKANDQFSQNLVLVKLEDRSFNDDQDGFSLTNVDIHGETYNNLLPDGLLYGKKSISTVSMPAIIIVNNHFLQAEDNKGVPNLYSRFVDALSQTISDIRSSVGQNK